MSDHGIYHSTIETTDAWLSSMMTRLRWEDPDRAWTALCAVLHTLRDRLAVDEAVALGAQLPVLLRGAYYEGWRPGRLRPSRVRRREVVLEAVASEMRHFGEPVDEEVVVEAVLLTLADHLSLEALNRLRRALPKELEEMAGNP